MRLKLLILVVWSISLTIGVAGALASSGTGGFAAPGDQGRTQPSGDGIPAAIYAQGETTAVFTYGPSDIPPGVPVSVEAFRPDDGVVVRTWVLDPAAQSGQIEWDGTVDTKPVPTGKYAFRFRGAASAASTKAAEKSFMVYDHMFPIRGKHTVRKSRSNGFGGGRNHKGQDILSSCGTPLVAANAGLVVFAGYQSAAGNYVVVEESDGETAVYMHMRSKAVVKKGERLLTGQRIGEVGTTGRSSTCHLHFELWSAPGWYKGGKAFDPIAKLREWDRWS